MMTMIRYVDLSKDWSGVRESVGLLVADVAKSGRFITGPHGAGLEEKLRSMLRVRGTVLVGSGTDALYLALLAAGVGPGDRVVTTPYTFVASGSSILRTGAIPEFVDVSTDTFNMDVVRLTERLTREGAESVRAVIFVHLFGNPTGVQAARTLTRECGVALIEDAAQALGATDGDKPVGAIGDFAATSFFPTKIVGAYGDGGAVFVNRDDHATELIRRLRNHGSDDKINFPELGVNSRLDELQAAVVSQKLDRLADVIEERQRLAQVYNEAFADLELDLQAVGPTSRSVFNHYAVKIETGNEALVRYLAETGVEARSYYTVPLHRQPIFSPYVDDVAKFPNADFLSRSVVCLPCYPGLYEEDQDKVIRDVRSFVARGGG